MIGGEEAARTADEGYLAPFGDLVVGLLFLFIIMLMAFGLSFRLAEEEAAAREQRLAEELEAVGRERDRLNRQHAQLKRLTRELIANERKRALMLEQIARLLKEREIEVAVEPEKGLIRLPERLLFASGEAELSASGKGAIGQLANVLARYLPCYSLGDALPKGCAEDPAPVLETVLVEGHTDDVPMRGERFRDNWDLAAMRSITTYNALIDAAPILARLSNAKGEALVGVSAYEALRPVVEATTDQARRMNRRIDLRFVTAAPSNERLDRLLAELNGKAKEDPVP